MDSVYTFNTNERSGYADYNCHWWRGNFCARHEHKDYYELTLTAEGTFFNTVNDTMLVQNKGDVVWMKPHVSHELSTKKRETALQFNIAVKSERMETFIMGKPSVKNELEENGFLFYHLSDATLSFVTEMIAKIDTLSFDARNVAVTEAVISAILADGLLYRLNDKPKRKISEYVFDALGKINDYSFVRKKANDLYALYPVSHTAFISEFKRITGETVVNYLARKKLDYTKMLLQTTDYSVLEISLMAGYESFSYFIKIFRDEFHVTPLQYRKQTYGVPTENLFREEK